MQRSNLFMLFAALVVLMAPGVAQARNYDAETGRWMTRDPLSMSRAAQADGSNLYAYVTGSPIANLDPNGLKTKKIIAVIAGQNFAGAEKLIGANAAGAMTRLVSSLNGITDSVVGGPFDEDSDWKSGLVNWVQDQIQAAEDNGFCKQKFFLIGHSNGGDAARKLAGRKFSRKGWKVALLVTIDPIQKPVHDYKSIRSVSNAEDWINYYQRDATFGFSIPVVNWFINPFKLQGYKLPGGSNRNIQIHYPPGLMRPHVNIASNSVVVNDIVQRVRLK